ncbi:MAG: hypothetical protein H7230_03850 [Candidatus Parcubacteria bacterium]|nr:hypothetical protein [Candidatus Paceibacterota bacterium]
MLENTKILNANFTLYQLSKTFILLLMLLTTLFVVGLGIINAQAAQSNNLETNMTSYIGSSGDDLGEATAISPDNTYWYGGSIIDTSVNYGQTPINIQGGGAGMLLHFAADGQTLLKVLRYPSSVKDISIDKITSKVAVVGAFGISYLNPTNYTEDWSRILPIDSAAIAENFVRGTHVDIGSNGNIGTLYGKRITIWDSSGTNLTGSGNTTFGINAKIVADIAMVGANNTVVVIGETQKDGGPCSQWRGGWMKAYDYTGNLVWKNYDWTQYEVSGTVPGLATNNCADTIPQRITLGADNNLYMISKSAGGNSMYRYDPKNLSVDLSASGKSAGGDNFNNTSNMSSQNITFMMKYAPTTGDIIKQQVWVSRTGTGAANSLVGSDIAVDSSGVIAMVGQTAAYFPDRLNQIQVVNGLTLPAYGNGYEGFYLELAPDMRTRIRATAFKKTRETQVASVAIQGNRRVLAGSTNYPDASIPTKNSIQPNIGGGNSDGFVSSWGFETAARDYAINATKMPTGQTVPLNSSFGTTLNYSYSGVELPVSTNIQFTVSEGIDYTNELYDGFSCLIITGNKKQCTKTLTAGQWQAGGSISLNYSVSRVLAGQKNKEIVFQVVPLSAGGQADLYPANNIATIPITIDDTTGPSADYSYSLTPITSGAVPLGGYFEVKIDYLYTGPVNLATDKKLKIIVPSGLEYDPLNRSGLTCAIVAGLETCTTTLLNQDLKLGKSRPFLFRVKAPYVGPINQSVLFGIYNQDGSVVDTIPANNQDQPLNILINPNMTATNDYQINLSSAITNVALGQATSPKINLKYTGNTPPISQRIIVTIPTGFSYNYLVNDGFVCIVANGIQTCQREVAASEWLTASSGAGLDINLNLIADSIISTPTTKTITAKLGIIAKNGEVDQTTLNNISSLDLTLSSTATPKPATLAIKVNLASSYDMATGAMKTSLRTKNLIPSAQPYNSSLFGYAGTESVTNTQADIVDWVLVEIRQGATTVAKKAGLLKSNGLIIDPVSQAEITFDGPDSLTYQVIIRHRNHLAISTNSNIAITANQATSLDLTTNDNIKGANQVMLKSGVFGLKLGNPSGNNVINSQDRSLTRTGGDANGVYRPEDLNMDGIISSADRILGRLTIDVAEIV